MNRRRFAFVFAIPLLLPSFAFARDFKCFVLNGDKPLAGAKVHYAFGGGDSFDIATDSAGLALIPLPDREAPFFEFEVSSPGLLSREVLWYEERISGIPGGITIQMHQGTPVTGLVTTDDGVPLANAKIHLIARHYLNSAAAHDLYQSPAQSDEAPVGEILSDSSGHWHSMISPTDANENYWLTIQHEDYVASEHSLPPGTSDYKQFISSALTVRMSPAAKISGTVRGPDSKPVPHARVLAYAGGSDFPVEAVADENGVYHFRRIAAGAVKILVVVPGMSLQFAATTAAVEKESTVDVQLAAGHVLTGIVTDRAHNPVANARVNFDIYKSYYADDLFHTYTAADGSFSWPGAPAESVQGLASAPGYQMRDQFHAQADKPAHVMLLGVTHIRVSVFDGATSAAIRNAFATRGDGQSPDAIFWESQTASANPDGSIDAYVLHQDRAFYLRVSAADHQPEILGPYEDSMGDLEESVMLQPAAATIGTIQPPAKNATVGLIIPHNDCMLVSNAAILGADQLMTPDGAGRFLIQPHLEKGSLLVLADEGFSFEPEDKMPIALTRWASFTGTLMQDGKPLAKVSVTLRWYPEAIPPRTSPRFSANFVRFQTDEAGHFSLPHLFPGTFEFRRYPRVQQGPGGLNQNELVYPGLIHLAAGESQDITLGGPGASLTGQLQLPPVLPPGWNASNSMLQEERSPELAKKQKNFELATLPVTVTPTGKFHLSNIPPGTYSLQLNILIPKSDAERGENPLVEESPYKPAWQSVTHLTITDKSPSMIDLGTLTLTPAPPGQPSLP